jgi:hypothetical protein
MGHAVDRSMRRVLPLILTSALMTGCTTEVAGEDEEVETLGKGDGNSSGFLGHYPVTTPIRINEIVDVPALGPALIALRGARTNPGEAVMRAIESQDFGLISTVIRGLPASTRTSIVNRINPILDPVKSQISDLAAQLEQLVASVEIHSDVMIYERGRILGITKERHTFDSVVFNLNGRSITIDVSGVFDEGHGSISSSGEAYFDDVDLDLPVGTLLLKAAGPYIWPRFGATDLTSTLKKLIDCDRIGYEISQVISFVDATTRCHEALASVDDKVKDAMIMEIEVRDAAGTIQNGTASGTWTWTMKLGGVELELPLRFEARRRD